MRRHADSADTDPLTGQNEHRPHRRVRECDIFDPHVAAIDQPDQVRPHAPLGAELFAKLGPLPVENARAANADAIEPFSVDQRMLDVEVAAEASVGCCAG